MSLLSPPPPFYLLPTVPSLALYTVNPVLLLKFTIMSCLSFATAYCITYTYLPFGNRLKTHLVELLPASHNTHKHIQCRYVTMDHLYFKCVQLQYNFCLMVSMNILLRWLERTQFLHGKKTLFLSWLESTLEEG